MFTFAPGSDDNLQAVANTASATNKALRFFVEVKLDMSLSLSVVRIVSTPNCARFEEDFLWYLKSLLTGGRVYPTAISS
jgi:hypothetical protein